MATNLQDAKPLPTNSIIGLGYRENITFTRGKKFFELTNHLGNVLATGSDRKIGMSLDTSSMSSYNPVITSAQEYYLGSTLFYKSTNYSLSISPTGKL